MSNFPEFSEARWEAQVHRLPCLPSSRCLAPTCPDDVGVARAARSCQASAASVLSSSSWSAASSSSSSSLLPSSSAPSSGPSRSRHRHRHRRRGLCLPAAFLGSCLLALSISVSVWSPLGSAGQGPTAYLAPRFAAAAVSAAAATHSSGLPTPGPHDLLVYGAGYLGRRVGQRWLAEHPEGSVLAVTRSEASHEELRHLGFQPVLASDLAKASENDGNVGKFQHVAVTVPPSGGVAESGDDDYVTVLKQALKFSSSSASVVFTSSGGVFSEDGGKVVDESSPTSADSSPRSAVLLRAEQLIRQAGGTVLRLAGLYDLHRGAHQYWWNQGVVRGNPEYKINLVHYEDAAKAVVAALQLPNRSPEGDLFLIGDGVPMSRTEIVEATAANPDFRDKPKPRLDSSQPSARNADVGKRYNVSRAQEKLKWAPTYPSFISFMQSFR